MLIPTYLITRIQVMKKRTILITERNILAGNIISLNIKRIVLILIQTCLVPKL